jgi:hypothetical protein
MAICSRDFVCDRLPWAPGPLTQWGASWATWGWAAGGQSGSDPGMFLLAGVKEALFNIKLSLTKGKYNI